MTLYEAEVLERELNATSEIRPSAWPSLQTKMLDALATLRVLLKRRQGGYGASSDADWDAD